MPRITHLPGIVFAVCTLLLAVGAARPVPPAPGSEGLVITEHNGYVELHVDGRPFFIHSAAFFYDRIPRDLWARLLDRYKDFGINTIDLYIPWNWHEPREGEFDFDGHTNPRRDLRGLLRLVSDKGFRLIARPGPQILNEWRHAGYPGWLLDRPEYAMPLADRLEGRYPPLSYLNTRDAEAAAKGWLDNDTHMAYTRLWIEAVAKELLPFSSRRMRDATAAVDGRPQTVAVSGPLLAVQLEDDLAIGRTNFEGLYFWKYVAALRDLYLSAGLDVPVFINPTDMRVSATGAVLDPPVGVMGQWYMPPRAENESGERLLTAEDASTIEFFTEELKTQPAFPPVFIEYQAGWYCPADDDRPLASPPENTLLSSRLALAHGIHGLNYFPLQDTLFPAGYEVPWANRYYRWDAALDPDGNPQPRARAVRRNAALLRTWGGQLAASHKRADFGILYPLGAFPPGRITRPDVLRVSGAVQQIERVAELAGLSSELLDPEFQPIDQLLRDGLLLLPVFDPREPRFQLSDQAQRLLVEFVRRGGVLVVFPERPAGALLDPLWQAPAEAGAPESAIAFRRRFGAGTVIESTKDFYSWISLAENFARNRAHFEAAWSAGALREFLAAAGLQPVLAQAPRAAGAEDLVVTELVSNEGTGLKGDRSAGRGFLSVTNLGFTSVSDEPLSLLAPGASARLDGKRRPGGDYLSLRVSLPPRDSLLLPLEQPLCWAAAPRERCSDVLISSGAELVGVEREGKTLDLYLYAPARAAVRLKLAEQPAHVQVDDRNLVAQWTKESNEFVVEVRRGLSPTLEETLKVSLHYTPGVTEKAPPDKNPPLEFHPADTLRLPLGAGASLASFPPLILLDSALTGNLMVEASSPPDQFRTYDFKVDGAVEGSAVIMLQPAGIGVARLRLKPRNRDALAVPGPEGLLHGTLSVHSGSDRQVFPVEFLVLPEKGALRYRFDFDRDGWPEWVLEDRRLRLVVSPEAGGRALALMDKMFAVNLITSVGAFRDRFAWAENPPGARPERARGRYGLFNRAYAADWVEVAGGPALRLRVRAPDVLPGGAEVEKTIRLVSDERGEAIEQNYRVSLDAPSAAPPGSAAQPQSFLAVTSVPAVAVKNRATQFCWSETRAGSPASHCESFAPGGAAVVLPADVRRVEIRPLDGPVLAFVANAGEFRIEMKNFSALVEIQFPPLAPGGPAAAYAVRLEVLSPAGAAP